MKIDRTKNTIRNSVWGLLNNIVGILLPFALRTVLLQYLGSEYLGLTSLFSSILGMLNLAELGFGSAIVYSMYKPISENDTDKICALLGVYRKVYRIIGCVVFGVGLCMMPFLHLFIKGGQHPEDISLQTVFLIELINVSIGYLLFGYRESLLQAHQRTDITSKVWICVRTLRYVFQIVVLIVIRNFYWYLIITPITTLLLNYINYRITTRQFPQYVCRGTLARKDILDLNKQVGGLMISKVCGVTRNGLDNIILSGFLGLSVVANYGNYYYLLTAVHGVLGVIGTSMRAGVGNSIACESVEKNYADFRKFTFLYAWISCICLCCFIGLYQPFMIIWVGENNLFSNYIMILFCIYFYLLTMTDVRNIYIDATGIWWKNKNRPIIETIMNAVLNIALGKLFGVSGVIIATIISLLIINIGYGAKILFADYFKGKKMAAYFCDLFYYSLIATICASAAYVVCTSILLDGIIGLVIRTVVCITIPNLLMVLCYCKHPMMIHVKAYSTLLLRKINKK